MNITNVPHHEILDANGNLHQNWRTFFSQLTTQLQTFLGDETYNLPKPDDARLSELNVEKHEGGILYNDSTKRGMINTEDNYVSPAIYSLKTLVTYEELTTAQAAAIPSGERNGRVIYETDGANRTLLGSNDTFITL